jgi:mRNA-degrading endonuclease RelE of RelBE toxin-antitoxin system
MTTTSVYVLPQALTEIDHLPGHVRQRVRRAIVGLRTNPQPPASRRLEYGVGEGIELRRLRLNGWRIVYLIDRSWNRVYVLAVRRRPPYRYDDLGTLVEGLE